MKPEIIRLIFFIVLIPLFTLSQKWIWDVIYSLSSKSKQEIYKFASKHTGKFRSRYFGWWLVESSSDRKKTRILIFVCSVLMALPLLASFIAFVGLFESALDSILNYVAVSLLILVVLTFLIGIVYKHRNNIVSVKFKEEFNEYKSAWKAHYKEQCEIYERGRKGSKFQIYAFGYLKLFIVIALMIGLFFLILDPAKPKSPEEVSKAVSEYGIELVDLTTYYKSIWDDKNNQLYTAFKGEKDDIYFEFFVFDNYDSASNILNQYAANIKRKAEKLDTEYKEQKTNYFNYTARVSGEYYILTMIKNTLVYANCDVENDEMLQEIVRAAGYLE